MLWLHERCKRRYDSNPKPQRQHASETCTQQRRSLHASILRVFPRKFKIEKKGIFAEIPFFATERRAGGCSL